MCFLIRNLWRISNLFYSHRSQELTQEQKAEVLAGVRERVRVKWGKMMGGAGAAVVTSGCSSSSSISITGMTNSAQVWALKNAGAGKSGCRHDTWRLGTNFSWGRKRIQGQRALQGVLSEEKSHGIYGETPRSALHRLSDGQVQSYLLLTRFSSRKRLMLLAKLLLFG